MKKAILFIAMVLVLFSGCMESLIEDVNPVTPVKQAGAVFHPAVSCTDTAFFKNKHLYSVIDDLYLIDLQLHDGGRGDIWWVWYDQETGLVGRSLIANSLTWWIDMSDTYYLKIDIDDGSVPFAPYQWWSDGVRQYKLDEWDCGGFLLNNEGLLQGFSFTETTI